MRENGGLFINQKKYRVVKYNDEINAFYLKCKGSTGGCMQVSK